MSETLWPQSADFETFHEYALAASLWVREHPDARLLRCSNCEAVLLYYPSMPPAQMPGHIYSDAGAREQQITGLCEWCFDQATAEPEDSTQDSLSKEDFDKLWNEASDA